MKTLAILLVAAMPVSAELPEGDWDFICSDGPTCTIKKEALVELARAARRSCSFRQS